jgi:hypothetical protein
LKFDSQRPYPSLDDFGISADAEGISKAAAAADHCSSSDSSKMDQGVTVAEIRPIADTLTFWWQGRKTTAKKCWWST